ncbi:MAG: flgD [Verrucomicrobiaceae bacterium]|nr:flgD [Verrucomicrobiaceae bacterium]
MAAVGDSTSGDSSAIIAALNKKNAATTSATGTTDSSPALGQDAFLKLLITQLKNQSPLDPQDNTAFVAQLAQFSSLQGIQNLNTTMTGLASGMQSSQALQASALVGRTVEVKSGSAYLSTDSVIRGTMSLDNSTADLQLKIYDSTDKLVMQKDFGAQAAGDLPFAWDGTNSAGTVQAAGTYKFVVTSNDSGKSAAVTTYLGANVNSVTMGANQTVTLNVNGVGQVALSDVKDIL